MELRLEEMITMTTMIAAPAEEENKSVDKRSTGRGTRRVRPAAEEKTC